MPKSATCRNAWAEQEPSAPLQRVRVAVVGCGAVARMFHVPVLAGHSHVRIAAFVDRNVKSAAELATAHGVEQVAAGIDQLNRTSVDAAVIAVPPAHHAEAAIPLLNRGIHVFVEKPMAVTSGDACAMVRAAEAAGVVLAVGQFRRLFGSTRMMGAVLDSRLLGEPIAFDVEEGDASTWPSATLGAMVKQLAGGGVLIDTGAHTLDQLLSFFTGPAELVEYRDNSLGGIESDCTLRLRVFHRGTPVEGRVELSRTRRLRNTFRIICERGVLELPVGERHHVSVAPAGLTLTDPASRVESEYKAQMAWNAPSMDGSVHEAFRAEVDDWLNAVRLGSSAYLSGRSVLPTVAFIEKCYKGRQPMAEPWVGQPVQRPAVPLIQAKEAKRRVLVTGAAGFIGCRVAEVLGLGDEWEVRALVHNPWTASRLARLPVEMVQGDLRSRADLSRAIEGCDAVVHCAYGTSWGSRREIFDVTVGGTRTLAEVARAAGVRRFVHLSTVAVHGTHVQGDLDESTPIAPAGDVYAESKAEAERVVLKAARVGLPAVILRLANVYGPYSGPFTIRPLQHLREGVPVLVGAGSNPSNTVYVDNVVHAILQALNRPVAGELFTISDEDGMSWADYYRWYADALGVEMRSVPVRDYLELRRQSNGGPLAWPRSWYRGVLDLATSAELEALARRMLQSDPVGRWPREALDRFPSLRRAARKVLGADRPTIYQPSNVQAAPTAPLGLLDVYASSACVRSDKARRLLEYAPVIDRFGAMELTLAWVRHARLMATP